MSKFESLRPTSHVGLTGKEAWEHYDSLMSSGEFQALFDNEGNLKELGAPEGWPSSTTVEFLSGVYGRRVIDEISKFPE